MTNQLLPALLCSLTLLAACSTATAPAPDAKPTPPLRHEPRDFSASWISVERGGAALRESGYQHVYATKAALQVSPAAQSAAHVESAPGDLSDSSGVNGGEFAPLTKLDAMLDSFDLPDLDALQQASE